MLKFSERLIQLREEKKLNKAEVAEKLEINAKTYRAYEQGLNQPSLETLIKIADYHKVSVDYLLGRTEIRNVFEAIRKHTNGPSTIWGADLTEEGQQLLSNYYDFLRQKYQTSEEEAYQNIDPEQVFKRQKESES